MSIFGHTKDVANELTNWVGTQMTWVPAAHGTSSLVDYESNPHAAAPSHASAPPPSLICFELPLLALLERGWIDRQGLRTIYQNLGKGMSALRATGPGASLNTYVPGQHQPNKGHVVFFNGLQHVAVATGNVANHFGVQGSEVLSFWTDAAGNLPPNHPVPNTPVMLDTIDHLVQVMTPVSPGPVVVNYAKPKWR